jgi:hypothetical protein
LFLPFVFWRVQGREVFPPVQPVATASRPGRRAVVKGAPPLGAAKQTLDWFDVGAFADAKPYTFGNAGYNVLIGPGLTNLDLGVRKIFSVTERQQVEFRAEFYNALNHPNFGLPSSDIDAGPGAAGAITSLNIPMRTVQFALKYRF